MPTEKPTFAAEQCLEEIASNMKKIQETSGSLLKYTDPTSPEFHLALTAIQLVKAYAKAVSQEKSLAENSSLMQSIANVFSRGVTKIGD